MAEPITVEDLQQGTPLAHYEIVDRIAQGGMGIVFKAYEPTLDREVAIKVLMPSFAADEQYVHDFQGEAQLVAALRHPHIIPIYYIGQVNEIVFFSMAFIRNQTLETWIHEGHQMSFEEAKWFLSQAVSALDHAAASDVIHLDIKPSNFLLDDDQHLILTDFGLAKNIRKHRPGSENEVFGTPGYVAPEQIRGEATDLRTDIYSLGATLFHLVVGKPPYDSTNPEEMIEGHLESPFPEEKAFAAGAQVSLVRLMEKMLEKDPSKRFQTYAELEKAIGQLEKFHYHASHRRHEHHTPLELPKRLQRLKELPGLLAVASMQKEGVKTHWVEEREAPLVEWAREMTQKSVAIGETLGLGKLVSLCVRVEGYQAITVKEDGGRLMTVQEEGGDLEATEVICQEIATTKN